jgi:arginyl-tRNA synthetase
MTLSQILTPSIEKAIQDLFGHSNTKLNFQSLGRNLRGYDGYFSSKVVKSNPVELE